MNQAQFDFDGKTFDPVADGPRLTSLFHKVLGCMKDSNWRTLREIQGEVGGSEAGISARLRDFRKPKFGGYRVNRRRRGFPEEGIFEYQVIV